MGYFRILFLMSYQPQQNMEGFVKYRFSVPLEEPRSKSYMKSYHVCYSRKLGRNISALGKLQFDNLLCLEMDANIKWYCERPLSEKLHVNGKTFSVEPSVYVVYADGTETFQLVTSGENESSVTESFNLWCVSRNENAEIKGYSEIYPGPLWMRNISYLAGRARRIRGSDKGADDAFIRYLSLNGAMTIGQLMAAGRLSEPYGSDYIADLYYKGLIHIKDMESRQISYSTEVECL